jgi:cytidylate kinase
VNAVAYKIVCISSEDGAGALEAAQLVAGGLGFRLIDETIVVHAAKEAGVDQDVMADVERRKSLLVRVIEGLGPAGLGPAGLGVGFGVSPDMMGAAERPSDELRGLIRSVIEETAAAGNAVIVAHAASLALGDREDVLRVAVTASPSTRERRLAEAGGLDAKAAARTIKQSDAARADYIKRFYGIGEELPIHYDLVINTDKLAPEHAAQLILQAAGASAGSAAPVS